MNPPSPSPDPRLGGRTAHYDRSAIIASITSLYASLPHIPASHLHLPPSSSPTGWPAITPSTLAACGIHKTASAIALLQHLPYISAYDDDPATDPDPSSSHPWIQPECFPCDYRLVARSDLTTRTRPGWMYDVRTSSSSSSPPSSLPLPPWVIQLTSGTDREGRNYLLDTSDGTVTASTVVRLAYAPHYAEDDPRGWRDRCGEEKTLTVAEWVAEVMRQWRGMEVLGVPPVVVDDAVEGEGEGGVEKKGEAERKGMGKRVWWPSLYFRQKGAAGPGDWQWGEVEELRKIYGEHGWPDRYRKEACQEAVREWWRRKR